MLKYLLALSLPRKINPGKSAGVYQLPAAMSVAVVESDSQYS